ncbi:transposase [Bdellovibrionota bacterium FG-2]
MRIRRQPEKTLLYQTVQTHYLAFRARYEELTGGHLPRHVEREFEGYLDCGILARGFVRVQCGSCGEETILGLSCKKRGWCPSCGARKMCEEAAFLRDQVLPTGITYRQWVLTVPVPLRYQIAKNPKLLGEVLGIFSREVRAWVEKRTAEVDSENAVAGDRYLTGSICFVQRFGDGLRLNPHAHMILPEGAFRVRKPNEGDENQSPQLSFVSIRRPSPEDVCLVLERVQTKVVKRLQKLGLIRPGAESDPVAVDIATNDANDGTPEEQLAWAFQQASIENRAVLGKPPGSKVRKERLKERNPVGLYGAIGESAQTSPKHPLLAILKGFSIHAASFVRPEVPGLDEAGNSSLENLLRYMARGSTPLERLKPASGGDILIKLKSVWSDGTTHLRFSGFELLEKLMALIPPPNVNMVRYSGVFAPNHKLRAQVVSLSPAGKAAKEAGATEAVKTSETDQNSSQPLSEAGEAKKKRYYIFWAELLRRVYKTDVTICETCKGPLTVTSAVQDPGAIRRILRSMGLPEDPPPLTAMSRAPPPETATYDEYNAWAD